MPPLDGTEFVAIWDGGIPCSGMYKVIDGIVFEYTDEDCDYVHNQCVINYGWENDLDARYFVIEK